MLRNIGTFANTQVDRIAVGGVFGAATMGRYDVAQDIAISPSQEVINPMVAVLFPVISMVQTDVVARRRLFLNALSWSALICISMSVGVALVHSDLVDLLLGRKWEPVKPLMPWFAFAFGILGMSSCVYPALESVGRAYMAARLQWFRVFALALAVFPAAYLVRDVTSVAIARFLITVAITPTLFYFLAKTLGLSLRDFASVLWRPFFGGLTMAIVVMALNTQIELIGPIRLLLDVVVGSSTYASVLMALWIISDRPDGPEQMLWRHTRPVLSVFRRASENAPASFSEFGQGDNLSRPDTTRGN
jgi:lipopolysaccharide exporter